MATEHNKSKGVAMNLNSTLLLRDVSLRDGLQSEQPLRLEQKVALFDALTEAGVSNLELTAFVRPDRVPAMADAEQLAQATSSRGGITRWGLVLNLRGVERALAAGIRHLQFVVSVSDRHNIDNAGRSVKESFDDLRKIVPVVAEHGGYTEVTLATAFGCPFTGPVTAAAVMQCTEAALAAGVDGIGLADTIGTAVPTEVTSVFGAVVTLAGPIPIGGHFHDTRGLAIANALAAISEGVTRLDASVGGLGGCPFAPGASGNVPLEDLVHALEGMGINTGIDLGRLLEAARLACDFVGRPIGSHIGIAGPRFAIR
jgi:hydroxymethylglutaryl-CoA lyase